MLLKKIDGIALSFSLIYFIHFSYAGDADFELSVKGITVGIEDLQVTKNVPRSLFKTLKQAHAVFLLFCCRYVEACE